VGTSEQILYMQVRIARMLSQRRGLTLSQAAGLLETSGGFAYIEDSWGLFHVEGDEAVYDDVCAFLDQAVVA